MKPNPFASLNHFTVPVMRAMTVPLLQSTQLRSLDRRLSGQNLCKCLRSAVREGSGTLGSPCYVTGDAAAIPAAEGDVRHRRRRVLTGISLDGSGTGWTAQRCSGLVAADEVKDLRWVVRVWTRLTHRPSDDPWPCATTQGYG
jgi:hypothetical protein